jgi:hypothetical protein
VASFTIDIPSMVRKGPMLDLEITGREDLLRLVETDSGSIPKSVRAVAMVDTGASKSVFSKELQLPTKLGINPIGVSRISTPSSENVKCFEYSIMVDFQGHAQANINALEAPFRGQHIQFLIGRDLLEHGVLVYIGYKNQFTLSF